VSATVAITGATGFIGRHLTERLVASGASVRAIVRPNSPSPPPRGAAVVGAPLDAVALRRAFGGVDAVVHLAGIVLAARPEQYTPVNVEGTRAVAEAAREAGARLSHISSLAAAGAAPASAPRSESDPADPVTPYGRSKLAGEQIVAGLAGLDWTILRPGVVYGPGDRAVLTLFRAVRLGIVPLIGNPDASYTFVHVADVVRSIEAALAQRCAGEVFFVGHPRPVSSLELLVSIGSALDRRPRFVPLPRWCGALAAYGCEAVARTTGWPLPLNRWRYHEMCSDGFVCRVDRLRDRLGVVAQVQLDEGIRETAAWYRRAGWL
jgi:nucleoside-diphosphate-sugar epimerase